VGQLDRLVGRFGDCALLVTGRTFARRMGLTDRIERMLAKAGVNSIVFDQTPPQPTTQQVDQARRLYRQHGCRMVVAVGGGSALDLGKAVAALADQDAPTSDYHSGDRSVPSKAAGPCIAIPTTSGTGAEVTPLSVLTDPDKMLKKSFRGEAMLPAAAVVDPELTVTCPPELTAVAGMDALTQAIESFWSIHATAVTDALAKQAIRLLDRHLLRAYRDGQDLEAREAVSYGSLLAGMALANARLGVVHGLAHPLGVHFGIPHGLICGLLLPLVMRFNKPHLGEKYAAVCNIFMDEAADHVEELLVKLDLANQLDNYALDRRLFPRIAREAMPSGSTKANPRPVSEADAMDLLNQLVA